MPAGPVPSEFQGLLESRAFAFVSTLGKEGAPQVNPIWFTWDGQNVLISLMEGIQKYVNLQRDNRIAVAIAHPSDPYRYLELRGTARIEPDAGNEVFTAISTKYTGSAFSLEPPDNVRYVARIEVERYTAQTDVTPPVIPDQE